MKLEIAKEINQLMLNVSANLDNSVRLVMDNSDSDELAAYRQAVGRIMGQIYCDILKPIYVQYPALAPDRLRGS